MADIKIKDVPLVSTITGQEKIPVSNGSGKPVTATIQQIIDKCGIPSIPTKISYFDNDIHYATESYVLENKLNVDKTLNINSNNPISNSTISSKIYSISDSLNYLLSISDTYEFVDLNLPSGLKWATCNVGAITPEDPGLYFAWGETQGYSGITNTKNFSWSDYELCNGSGNQLTKYINISGYGEIDNLTVLEQVDDAAYQVDNNCRMPTQEEFRELIDNTTITKGYINNIQGLRFTSNKNHNYIFIPFGGRLENGNTVGKTVMMQLWSSSVTWTDNSAIQFIGDYSTRPANLNTIARHIGSNIRAVQEATTSSKFNPKETVSKLSELDSKTVEIESQLSNVYTKSEVDAKILELQTLINNYINGTSQVSELGT